MGNKIEPQIIIDETGENFTVRYNGETRKIVLGEECLENMDKCYDRFEKPDNNHRLNDLDNLVNPDNLFSVIDQTYLNFLKYLEKYPITSMPFGKTKVPILVYKQTYLGHKKIITKLLILPDTEIHGLHLQYRANLQYKFRTEKAYVYSQEDLYGNSVDCSHSFYDNEFIYHNKKFVEPKDPFYSKNDWLTHCCNFDVLIGAECASGTHYFNSLREAMEYTH